MRTHPGKTRSTFCFWRKFCSKKYWENVFYDDAGGLAECTVLTGSVNIALTVFQRPLLYSTSCFLKIALHFFFLVMKIFAVFQPILLLQHLLLLHDIRLKVLLSALGEVIASPRLEADTTSLSSEDYVISIKLNLTSALKSYKKLLTHFSELQFQVNIFNGVSTTSSLEMRL